MRWDSLPACNGSRRLLFKSASVSIGGLEVDGEDGRAFVRTWNIIDRRIIVAQVSFVSCKFWRVLLVRVEDTEENFPVVH